MRIKGQLANTVHVENGVHVLYSTEEF